MQHARTWILVADGARARILANDGPGQGLVALADHVYAADHAATHDLVTDRQSRTHASMGERRSAIEPETDPHRDLKARFARHLADVLERGLTDAAYRRLIVIAPPVTLGDLRKSFAERVRAVVVHEIAHDLTKVPNSEIPAHLQGVLRL